MANFINKMCGATSTGIAKVLGSNYSATNKINSILDNRYSIDFDGAGDYIDASTSADNISTNTGSACMWVKLDASSNNESFFAVGTGTAITNKIALTYSTSGAEIRLRYKGDSTDAYAVESISSADFITLSWTHFAMTWDNGTDDEIKLYRNGSLIDTQATLTHYDTTPDRVHLGKASNADNTYHDGHMDNFALWTSVLTADEITAIYNVRNPDFTAAFTDTAGNTYDSQGDLIQWLRMLENTGTSLADSSGNSNTATIVNATWASDPAF